MPLSDGFDRVFRYLRLSVTEVCNFRCQYCLPNGYKPCGEAAKALTIGEVRRAAIAFAGLGLRKIRLTGGEPTVRSDFTEIIQALSDLHTIETLALTTNGYRLFKKAREWRDAGISAINISVDSLSAQKFHQITGHDRLNEVMQGVEAAILAGFKSVKLNVVYMKGINDGEINNYLALAKKMPLSIRFIELMETGDRADFFKKHYISTGVIEAKLVEAGWTLKLSAATAGPAKQYIHPEYQGSIGLIAPYSKGFCKSCNRLRFSSSGKLHLCLFGEFGIPLRELLQHDAQLPELTGRIQQAVKGKKHGHRLGQGFTGQTSNLSAIGE